MRPSDQLNWNDLKLILALAEAGYVNRAAEQLGVDPTTIPRRIKRIEKSLGVKLIERIKGGVVLTQTSEALLELARQVEEGVNTTLAQTDVVNEVAGVVKVSATDFVFDLISDELTQLIQNHPKISLDLRPTNKYLSLERRETDIAIRLSDSPDDSLVGRRLSPISISVYGLPKYAQQKTGLPWLSWNFARGLSQVDKFIFSVDPQARIVARVDSMITQAKLVASGMGVAILPDAYIASHRELGNLVHIHDAWAEEAWVLTHEELRNVPRILLVKDAIAAAFKAKCGVGKVRKG